VCTGFMDEAMEDRLDKLGIRHRLAKPLKKAGLAGALRDAIDGDDA